MTSNDILFHFNIIDLKDAINYLSNSGLLTSGLYDIVQHFIVLTEEQMSNYCFPNKVSQRKIQIVERYGKNSDDYKKFNTMVTAIAMIVRCAQVNEAIRKLYLQYKQREDEYPYLKIQSKGYNELYYNWNSSQDADVQNIKDAAITARDEFHAYSKKYTIEGFDDNFVNKLRLGVYNICSKFYVDTHTTEEKIENFAIGAVENVIGFALMLLMFFLVAKCAISN